MNNFETRAKSATLKNHEIESWINGVLKEEVPQEFGYLLAFQILHMSVVALDLAHVIVTLIVEYEWLDEENYGDEKELANEEPIPVDLGATVYTGGR